MSQVEYERLKLNQYVLNEMKEIATDNPNAARALFIPLSICQMIECVVAPIFVILEELYLMLSGQEWEGAFIIVSVLKLIVSPFVILGTFYSLMCGFSDPLQEIKRQDGLIEYHFSNMAGITINLPDFPEKVADHFYKSNSGIDENKRMEIVQKIKSELAKYKQLEGTPRDKYFHLMRNQNEYLSEFIPLN